MASLQNSQLAQITARCGVLRCGTGRLNVTLVDHELKVNTAPIAGQVIWNRPVADDGNPSDTAASFTTRRF